jgi:chemotaxis protein MotB
MRKRIKQHGNQERWMVSYADFMTLLFAFFVVLYSSSQVDKAKMASLSNAIAAGFQDLGVGAGEGGAPVVIPGTTPAAFTHPARPQAATEAIRRKLEIDLSPELQHHIVSLRQTPEGLVLSLHEVGFFDSGSAALHASSMDTFDRIGSVIASVGSNLRIEGHTDNVPIHTVHFLSNWELSTARATEIIRIFITRENIGPERLSAAGYAEYHPVADNSTEDGRRLNRRVDIVIITAHQTAPAIPGPGVAQRESMPAPQIKESSTQAD